MKESEKLLNELTNIRDIMERSSQFLSLSGLSGILVGTYALIGSFLTHRILYVQVNNDLLQKNTNDVLTFLLVVGISVLVLSLLTIFLLTIRKARKEQKSVWGSGSKLLLVSLFVPLVTGAILISVFILQEYYEIISALFLIFYGLALVNAAKYTRPEILGLGIIEILLGLVAAIFPGFGLYLWAAGFGLIHIIYGFIFLRNESKIPA